MAGLLCAGPRRDCGEPVCMSVATNLNTADADREVATQGLNREL